MSRKSAEEIYDQHVKALPASERLRLLQIINRETAKTSAEPAGQTRNILELHGLGAEIWQDVDAQDYVNELRDEWERNR